MGDSTGSGQGTGTITALLQEWRRGDRAALDRLTPLVYDELRALARRHLRGERHRLTLQPTALVHEAYLRLVGGGGVAWEDRAHFFGVASRLMRQVLVDHARARRAKKRGGEATFVDLTGAEPSSSPDRVDVLALHEALDRLAVLDAASERIVEMRYFGGLTIEETAEVLATSPATVKRDWNASRAWLLREMGR
jgi:RNA polymerase sigma factor (TIGR02999 family)